MESTLFEQHYRSKGWPQSYFIPHSGGHIRYGRAATQDAWEGWQARALLAAPAAGTGQDIPTDSIDRLTREKAAHIIARDGFQVSGVVMTKPNGSVCIVDKSAVRWLDSRELFRVMHPDAPPAATGAHGLSDEQIATIKELLQCFSAWDKDVRVLGNVRAEDAADAMRAILAQAAPSGEPVAYVECRECGRCGHTGINDAHSQDECCSNCDWTGPAPKEDVCPGCAQTGTMRAACPKCGSVYRLLCETTVGAAPQPSVGGNAD